MDGKMMGGRNFLSLKAEEIPRMSRGCLLSLALSHALE